MALEAFTMVKFPNSIEGHRKVRLSWNIRKLGHIWLCLLLIIHPLESLKSQKKHSVGQNRLENSLFKKCYTHTSTADFHTLFLKLLQKWSWNFLVMVAPNLVTLTAGSFRLNPLPTSSLVQQQFFLISWLIFVRHLHLWANKREKVLPSEQHINWGANSKIWPVATIWKISEKKILAKFPLL